MNRIVLFSFSEFLTLLERRTTPGKIDADIPLQQKFSSLVQIRLGKKLFAFYQGTTSVVP
jgi:hypothetical protein